MPTRNVTVLKTKKFTWNFATSNSEFFVRASRKRTKKLFKRYSLCIFASRRRIALFLFGLSLSWMLNQFTCLHAKRVKSFKLEIFRREKRLLEWLHFLCVAHSLLLLLLFNPVFLRLHSFLFAFFTTFWSLFLHKIDTLAIHRRPFYFLPLSDLFSIFAALPLFHHFLRNK